MQILSNLGNWLSYIATLLVVDDLSNGKGIYLSAVLVIHFLPSFGLFPIAGVVADRYLISYPPLCHSASNVL